MAGLQRGPKRLERILGASEGKRVLGLRRPNLALLHRLWISLVERVFGLGSSRVSCISGLGQITRPGDGSDLHAVAVGTTVLDMATTTITRSTTREERIAMMRATRSANRGTVKVSDLVAGSVILVPFDCPGERMLSAGTPVRVFENNEPTIGSARHNVRVELANGKHRGILLLPTDSVRLA